MGRTKQHMEFITKERERMTTYRKRKEGLRKKAHELKTLCDVEVCLIIHGPKIDGRPIPETEIWPSNPDVIRRLIDSYKNQSNEDRVKRTSNLSNYFEERTQKIEDALVKLRKKNDEATYSTWDDRFNDLSKEELRQLQSLLDRKLQEVKAKVAMMRKAATQNLGDHCSYAETTQNHTYNNYSMQATALPAGTTNIHGLEDIDAIAAHYSLNQTRLQTETNSIANPLAMMMMMMNNSSSDCAQMGGGVSGCGNFLYNSSSMDRGAYNNCDPMTLENVVANNFLGPVPLGYCSPNMQTMSPNYLQCLKMTGASSSVQLPHVDEFKLREFQMKNMR